MQSECEANGEPPVKFKKRLCELPDSDDHHHPQLSMSIIAMSRGCVYEPANL